MKVNIKEYSFEVVDEHITWFWPLVNKNRWGEFEFSSIEKCPNKKMMWDIGAWNGVTSLYASKLYENVISWEPDWKAYNYLIENIKINDIKNVLCIREGIYNKEDIISFGEGSTGRGSSTSSIKSSKNSDLSKIKVSTLSKSVEKYGIPDFLKIDIEGAEEDIIEELLSLNIKK